MNYYFAALLPAMEGGYVVLFPDFPEASTQGETMEEAIDMAADALAVVVDEYAKVRKPLPEPMGFGEACEWADKCFTESDQTHTLYAVPIVQAVKAPNIDTTPVRVSVSFAKAALDEIDAKAKANGYTRSGFLAHAAKMYHAE